MNEVARFNATQLFQTESASVDFEQFLSLCVDRLDNVPFFQWCDFTRNLPNLNSTQSDISETASSNADPVYSIPLDGSISVDFHEADLKNFRFLRRCFESIDPETLDKTFADALDGAGRARGLSSQDGKLDHKAFQQVMEVLVPADEITLDDRKLLTFLLNQCFRIFDRNHDGYVDRDEFVRGLQVLLNIDRDKLVALAFMMVIPFLASCFHFMSIFFRRMLMERMSLHVQRWCPF